MQLLLGMPANTEVHYRVASSNGIKTEYSEDHTVTTGDLPSALPDLMVWGTSAKGYRIFPVIGSWSGTLIVDSMGRVVWYYAHIDEDSVSIQSRLTADGKYVVINSPCHLTKKEECGSMIWISLDGAEQIRVPVDGIGHDFTQLGDETLCAIVNDTREVEGLMVTADRLVEVDMGGEQTEIWSAWDTEALPTFEEDIDWTHANAIEFSEEEDAYYVGLAFLSTIVKINRSTGEVVWRLGGEDSDFAFSEGSERFTFHHGFHLREGILSLFANGSGMQDPSRVVRYEIDEEAMTIDEVWRYSPDPPLYAYALGDVEPIADGTLHVTFSTAGYIEQIEGDEAVWALSASFPHAFGYSNFYSILYAKSSSDEPRKRL